MKKEYIAFWIILLLVFLLFFLYTTVFILTLLNFISFQNIKDFFKKKEEKKAEKMGQDEHENEDEGGDEAFYWEKYKKVLESCSSITWDKQLRDRVLYWTLTLDTPLIGTAATIYSCCVYLLEKIKPNRLTTGKDKTRILFSLVIKENSGTGNTYLKQKNLAASRIWDESKIFLDELVAACNEWEQKYQGSTLAGDNEHDPTLSRLSQIFAIEMKVIYLEPINLQEIEKLGYERKNIVYDYSD